MSQQSRGSNRQKPDPFGTLKSLQDVPRAIHGGEVKRCYALCGEDRYLLDKLVGDVVDALLPPQDAMRSLNIHVLDGDVSSSADVTTTATTAPMGSPRRVVVYKHPPFLRSKGGANVVTQIRKASGLLDSGDADRAVLLLRRALKPADGPTDDPTVLAKAAAIRPQIAEQAPDCLPFLDNASALIREANGDSATDEQDDLDTFLEWIRSDLSATSVVVMYVPGPAMEIGQALRRVQKVGCVADVDTLKVQGGRQRDPVDLFIKKEVQASGGTIRDDAVRRLREKTGSALSLLAHEIEKVMAYVGDRLSIELADVDAVVTDASDVNIFALTNAVADRNLAKALEALATLDRVGEPPLLIHGMLTRQVRLMLQARFLEADGLVPRVSRQTPYRTFLNTVYGKWPTDLSDRLPAKGSLNVLEQKPYPAYLAMRSAMSFTTGELLAAYDDLLECDEHLKSGRASDMHALQAAVVRLVRRS